MTKASEEAHTVPLRVSVWSHHARLAANQKRLSTTIVLNTAPLNVHQWGCSFVNDQRPTIPSVATKTTAQLIPQGVWTCAIAF